MTKDLLMASAGAGKSRLIAEKSLNRSADNQTVLILTYTTSNQEELLKKICDINTVVPNNITIKGWFRFLLEDLIRPYQRAILQDRVPGIYFNKNGDPHTKNNRYILGRSEKNKFDEYNTLHFLTKNEGKAHTAYLSKLAARIHAESKGKAIERLLSIYDAIYIDEVQDLVGWDYEIINEIVKVNKADVFCVGDFRQTIYSTAITQKKPKTNIDKIERFKKYKFDKTDMNISWRCNQSICDFSDLVHENEGIYPDTISKIETPEEYSDHVGVYTVSTANAQEYIRQYKPVILRVNRKTKEKLCEGSQTYNFGESKGLGFNRVLIIATDKQKGFLAGKMKMFDDDKTGKAKSALYVAITRARYSVAFVCDTEVTIGDVEIWEKP